MIKKKKIKQIVMACLIATSVFIGGVKAEETTTPEKPIDIEEIVTTEHTISDNLKVYNPANGDLLINAKITGSYYVDYNPNTGERYARDCSYTYTYLYQKTSKCKILSSYITYYSTNIRMNFTVKNLNGSSYVTGTFYLYEI